ncbi:MAG: FprA family A-type flavoprotein [Rikenellaceae bacterium]
MNNTRKISDRISWIGVNDRTTELFESMWPLPNGVAYNCYLINDEKTALLDTVKLGSSPDFVDTVEHILDGKTLDYLIVNHVELDHTGELKNLVKRYPNIKIIGNAKTNKMLENYFGLGSSLQEVKEGDTLSLGHHELTFVFTPWVHWPEVMVTYDKTEKVLFSADAFGSFGTLDGGIFDDELNFDYYKDDMLRYYSNIVGKYSKFVQKAFEKLSAYEIKTICPLHGMVWRSEPQKVIGLYDKWSKQEADDAVVVIYGSMYGNTAIMADEMARELSAAGVKDIRVYDVSKTHVSFLISEVWRCKGVVLGSCAYNGEMFPLMANLTHDLLHVGAKNKVFGVFGSYTWSGGGVKNLKLFGEAALWEMVPECLDMCGTPNSDKLLPLKAIAKSIAERLKTI